MEKYRKYARIRSKMYSPGSASVDLADAVPKSDGRLDRCTKKGDGLLNRRPSACDGFLNRRSAGLIPAGGSGVKPCISDRYSGH